MRNSKSPSRYPRLSQAVIDAELAVGERALAIKEALASETDAGKRALLKKEGRKVLLGFKAEAPAWAVHYAKLFAEEIPAHKPQSVKPHVAREPARGLWDAT